MKTLLRALVLIPLAVASVFAQGHAQAQKGAVAEPQGVMVEPDRAKMAIEKLKSYTDSFRVPGGEAFPAPPPITMFKLKDVLDNNFSYSNTAFQDYKQAVSDYRQHFFWDEGNDSDSVKLDAERFQVAYAQASKRGADAEGGARWVCGLADALRNYFVFFNEQDGGEKGKWLSIYTWGVGTGVVDHEQAVNSQITNRYKEATGIDLKDYLNYATVERCQAAVKDEIAKNTPKPVVVQSLMKPPTPPEQVFMKEDLSDIDTEKYNYWVFYYDASWQSWGYVAKTTKWKPTADDLKRFIRCRAPFWVGNFVARAPKDARAGGSPYFPPKGSVTIRHPSQPEKASLRDKAAIAAAKKKYCR